MLAWPDAAVQAVMLATLTLYSTAVITGRLGLLLRPNSLRGIP